MRPQNFLQENLNFVESLSDDDELHEFTYDIDCSKNLQALYSHQKKENDARSRFPFTYAAARVQKDCINLEKESQQHEFEWSAILEEANELAGLQEKTYNLFNKGGKGNPRFKFSFRSLPNKEDFSRTCSSLKDETFNSFEEDIEVPGEQDYFEHQAGEDTVPQLLGNILEENAELDNKPGFHKQLVGAASVMEQFKDMHKTNPSQRRKLGEDNSKKKERQKSSSKRRLLNLGDRVLGNKDVSEFTGEISSEDEDIDQDYQRPQIVKGQTMADMFQEAFNTSTEDAAEFPRINKFGYHERLQKVMHLEKDRHLAYSKQLHTRQAPSDESNCIDVRILSRTLEAKLIVCQCLFGESYKNQKKFQGLGYDKINQKNREKTFLEGHGNGKSTKKTIIFSPTLCGHVELEVGNIVCIHSPWKEVQAAGGESIILCTYFSPPHL